jgi:4'-phosphopantetheinyl transferase
MQLTLSPIKEDEVHIWRYKFKGWQKGCLSVLSEEEKYRWLKFALDEHGKRYAMAHAFLRKVLERYAGIPAEKINIAQSLNKKPQLKHAGDPPLYFNLSYRDEYALVAISTNPNIGIDIETVKNVGHISSFMGTFFSYEERQKILQLRSLCDRLALLFTIWVMKEALVKAKANGISEAMSQYNLCPFLNHPECVPDFDIPNTWHIAQIRVADNYKAACAVQSGNIYLKNFEYGSD